MKRSLVTVIGLWLISGSLLAAEGVDRAQSASINSDMNNDPLDEYFETDSLPSNHRGLMAQAADGTDSSATATPATKDGTSSPAAAKSTKKKKKKSVGVAADSLSTSGHGEQESNLPYKAAVDLDLSYQSENKTQKYSNESYKIATTDISFSLTYLFVFGRFEAGPKIAYSSETMKRSEATTTTVTTKGTAFGAAFVFNLGNIHQDKIVPFVGIDVDRYSLVASSKQEESDYKESDTETRPGFSAGAKIFMGGHIALKPMIQYQMVMGGEHKIENPGEDALVASVTGSKLMLGMGLAKYF